MPAITSPRTVPFIAVPFASIGRSPGRHNRACMPRRFLAKGKYPQVGRGPRGLALPPRRPYGELGTIRVLARAHPSHSSAPVRERVAGMQVAEITEETCKMVARTALTRVECLPRLVGIGKDAGKCELGD